MIDDTLAALADPTRRSVVELLGREPMRAGALADALDVSGPALSRHLRVLRKAGLVDVESSPDDARVRVYRLRPQHFDELRGWADEVAAFWTNQLDAFRDHVERG